MKDVVSECIKKFGNNFCLEFQVQVFFAMKNGISSGETRKNEARNRKLKMATKNSTFGAKMQTLFFFPRAKLRLICGPEIKCGITRTIFQDYKQ